MSAAAPDIRILIADDHAMFRDALRNLLEQEPGLRVVGEANDSREILDKVRKLTPDIVLLDLGMQQSQGMEVLLKLQATETNARTIILTASIERDEIIEALKLGARGVVLKDAPPQLLFKSIRTVMSDEYWVGHDSIAGLINSLRAAAAPVRAEGRSSTFRLTRREFQIVASIVDGCTNRDIAEKLSISEQTVKHHLTNIFAKVGVTNRLELAFLAIHQSLDAA